MQSSSSVLQTVSTHHKDGCRYYQPQSCASVSIPSHFIGAIFHFAAHSFFVRMISRFCVKEMETPLGERNVIASAKEHTLVFPVRWFKAQGFLSIFCSSACGHVCDLWCTIFCLISERFRVNWLLKLRSTEPINGQHIFWQLQSHADKGSEKRRDRVQHAVYFWLLFD